MQRRRGPVRDPKRRVGSVARGGGLEGPLEASEAAMDPPPAPKDQTRPATYWPDPHLLLREPSSASALLHFWNFSLWKAGENCRKV